MRALDLRLVDGGTDDPEAGKLTVASQRIAAIHHATRDHAYLDEHGQPALRSGALQLVFCDVSTPAGAGWNAYDELRALLVERGVPTEAIRYMQGASTDAAKAKLFAACRDGSVAVLVGSTETMGVGTNVQARAIAMHHMDAPWRPADIEQRDGRILRQGNQNPEVQVLRYVTEGSFDTYMWLVNRTSGSACSGGWGATMAGGRSLWGFDEWKQHGHRRTMCGARIHRFATCRPSGFDWSVRSSRMPAGWFRSGCRSRMMSGRSERPTLVLVI